MTTFRIKELSFTDVKPIWDNYLWAGRDSKETNNWSWNKEVPVTLGKSKDNKKAKTTYIGFVDFDDCIIAVNSFYTVNGYTRSRGLYVFEKYRGLGLGKSLLIETIKRNKASIGIWSVPRGDALSTYLSAGFITQGEAFEADYGTNSIVAFINKNPSLETIKQSIVDKTKSSSFCVLPWIHVATSTNGDLGLCCSSGDSKDKDGNSINLETSTIKEYWNSDYMKSVRLDMLNSRIPSACSRCQYLESNNISSKRIWDTNMWMNDDVDLNELIKNTLDDGSYPLEVKYFDLRLGNTCNLKCVTCSSHDSSEWVNDQNLIASTAQSIPLKTQMDIDTSKTGKHSWYQNDQFFGELYGQLPNIREMYFAGGEPFMIKEHTNILKEIIKRGYSNKIHLRYTTNSTLMSKGLLDMWSNFKKVSVGCSIDSIYDRDEYIRFPTNFKKIEKNLHILDNSPSNIEVSITAAIQILNIKHIPDFIKWKVRSNFKKVNFEVKPGNVQSGGGLINSHLLYSPNYLSVQCLPKEDKDHVRELFGELKEWLWENYTQDDNFWHINPYGWKRWEGLLTHMDLEDQSELLPALSEYMTQLDILRDTDASETFPELAHLF